MTMRSNFPRTAGEPTFTAPRLLTKSDTAADAVRAGRLLLVESAGTATLHFDDGTDAVDVPLPAGIVPIGGVVRVGLTGTAGDIWLLD